MFIEAQQAWIAVLRSSGWLDRAFAIDDWFWCCEKLMKEAEAT